MKRRGLLNGTVLAGTWRIERELEVTRTSVVYRAVHVRTQIPAAVKLLAPASPAIDETRLRRFEREAMITAGMTSANVLRVLDYGRTADDKPYMVLELLAGTTLDKVLATRRAQGDASIPAGAAIAIADSVLRALMEAHGQSLVHRSVKPANIFLQRISGNDVVVKLVDFGIAKDLEAPMTSMGETLGTPSHMSPEQTRGKQIDGRSDLYSLGVVLYQCLTGTLPFNAATSIAMAVAHSTQVLEPIEVRSKGRVAGALAAVINKALAKDPDERWQDAQAMRDALLAVAGSETAGAVLGGPADILSSAPPALPDIDSTGPLRPIRSGELRRKTPAAPTLQAPVPRSTPLNAPRPAAPAMRPATPNARPAAPRPPLPRASRPLPNAPAQPDEPATAEMNIVSVPPRPRRETAGPLPQGALDQTVRDDMRSTSQTTRRAPAPRPVPVTKKPD